MLGDTIFAIASPPGMAARGLIRISGPDSRALADAVLETPLPAGRAAHASAVLVLGHRVDCLALHMPAPASYTGEDVVELHLPGAPLLLDEVCGRLASGARAATPGEFTRRAFEQGRLDLAEAEAVQQLIHAEDLEASRAALAVLRGGLAAAVDEIRAGIQDGLALLEAGLDFGDDETGAVETSLWSPSVAAARDRCTALLAGLPRPGREGDLLLRGAANAGKSSLANALVGRDAALVSPVPGTTRDVLAFELAPGVRLLDGPGDLDAGTGEATDRQALDLRDRLADQVAGVLDVVDLTAPRPPAATAAAPCLARVFTKVDLYAKPPPAPGDGPPVFVVSARTGVGIEALLGFLRSQLSGGPRGLGGGLHHLLGEAVQALDRAGGGIEAGQPEELIALDLGDALAALDQVHGRSSPEDLLDRIFAGFCLGK